MLPGNINLGEVEMSSEKVRLAKADSERTEHYMLRVKRCYTTYIYDTSLQICIRVYLKALNRARELYAEKRRIR